MEKELYELRRELANCKDGEEFVRWCMDNGSRNDVDYGYLTGVLDALYWSKHISQVHYTRCYKALGL